MDGGQILCPVVRHTLRPTPFLTLVDNSTQYLLLASARANPSPSYPLYSKHPVGIFSYMPCSDSHENHAAKQTKFSCIHFLFCMCWQRTNVIFESLLRWFLRAIHSTQEPILLFFFFFNFFYFRGSACQRPSYAVIAPLSLRSVHLCPSSSNCLSRIILFLELRCYLNSGRIYGLFWNVYHRNSCRMSFTHLLPLVKLTTSVHPPCTHNKSSQLWKMV